MAFGAAARIGHMDDWDATRIPLFHSGDFSSPSKQIFAAEMQMGSRRQHVPQDALLIFNVASGSCQVIQAHAEFSTRKGDTAKDRPSLKGKHTQAEEESANLYF